MSGVGGLLAVGGTSTPDVSKPKLLKCHVYKLFEIIKIKAIRMGSRPGWARLF